MLLKVLTTTPSKYDQCTCLHHQDQEVKKHRSRGVSVVACKGPVQKGGETSLWLRRKVRAHQTLESRQELPTRSLLWWPQTYLHCYRPRRGAHDPCSTRARTQAGSAAPGCPTTALSARLRPRRSKTPTAIHLFRIDLADALLHACMQIECVVRRRRAAAD